MENLPPVELLKTPIHAWHLKNVAKMADFGGWEMPIEYGGHQDINGDKGGVLAEHLAVRKQVGLFDVSHLGKIEVYGDTALNFLNTQFTNDLLRLSDGQAQYNLLCNEQGGVVDDLMVYRRSKEDFLLIPNAANCTKVFDILNQNTTQSKIVNSHKSYAVFALQGPGSNKVLEILGVKSDLDYMSFSSISLPKFRNLGEVILCRTGYTGEFGYEFLPKWEAAQEFWEVLSSAVFDSGGRVCGLGARDTLRTEMGYSLHGHELSPLITPLQASSGWAVALNKGDFIGSASLLAEKKIGPSQILRGLKLLEKGIPRPGMVVKSDSGVLCGEITSGTFSPTLQHGIALALLDPSQRIGSILSIDIRGKQSRAQVVKPPFVSSNVN